MNPSLSPVTIPESRLLLWAVCYRGKWLPEHDRTASKRIQFLNDIMANDFCCRSLNLYSSSGERKHGTHVETRVRHNPLENDDTLRCEQDWCQRRIDQRFADVGAQYATAGKRFTTYDSILF